MCADPLSSCFKCPERYVMCDMDSQGSNNLETGELHGYNLQMVMTPSWGLHPGSEWVAEVKTERACGLRPELDRNQPMCRGHLTEGSPESPRVPEENEQESPDLPGWGMKKSRECTVAHVELGKDQRKKSVEWSVFICREDWGASGGPLSQARYPRQCMSPRMSQMWPHKPCTCTGVHTTHTCTLTTFLRGKMSCFIFWPVPGLPITHPPISVLWCEDIRVSMSSGDSSVVSSVTEADVTHLVRQPGTVPDRVWTNQGSQGLWTGQGRAGGACVALTWVSSAVCHF